MLIVNVARSADEATRQARGEDVTESLSEAEEDAEAARVLAEALFEAGDAEDDEGEAEERTPSSPRAGKTRLPSSDQITQDGGLFSPPCVSYVVDRRDLTLSMEP